MPRYFILLAVFLALALWLTPPAARATAGEEMIGNSCSTGQSNLDWDTVGQCNGTTFAHGPLILGAMTDPPYSATTCTSSNAGMVQYTGGLLEYCNGSSWLPLSSGPGPGVLISTQTASSTASLQFKTLPTSYNTLFLNCAGLLTSTTAGIYFLVGEGATPTWETGADYTVVGVYSDVGSSHAVSSTTATDLTDTGTGNTNTSIPASVKMYIDNVGSSSVVKMATVQESDAFSGGLVWISYESYWNNDTNPITGLEVVPSTGNIASGTCSLYGMN
jgi:hypothetical protein